jgi:uncharacterized phage-associated protein
MFDSVSRGSLAEARVREAYPRPVTLPVHVIAAELRARRPDMGTLKLHKLLYYCQGHHLAAFGQPLFPETISAWDKGPVVGALWYAEKNGERVSAHGEPDEAALNTIGYVLSRYSALSGRDLMHLTHNEDPWQRADQDRPPNTSRPIAVEWMAAYFRSEAVADDDEVVLDAAAVKEWLRDAGSTRDAPARPDDPAALLARIEELQRRTSARAR